VSAATDTPFCSFRPPERESKAYRKRIRQTTKTQEHKNPVKTLTGWVAERFNAPVLKTILLDIESPGFPCVFIGQTRFSTLAISSQKPLAISTHKRIRFWISFFPRNFGSVSCCTDSEFSISGESLVCKYDGSWNPTPNFSTCPVNATSSSRISPAFCPGPLNGPLTHPATSLTRMSTDLLCVRPGRS